MYTTRGRLSGTGPATGRPPDPWPGTAVMVRHFPNGLVAATSRGQVATGLTEGEALRRLASLLGAADGQPAVTPPVRSDA